MKYKIGLVVGRFQPITAGQELLIKIDDRENFFSPFIEHQNITNE